MANWCENILVVEGAPEEIVAFDKAFKGTSLWETQVCECQKTGEKKYCLNALFTVPEDILKQGNALSWAVSNWGTREIGDMTSIIVEERFAEYCFDTAWMPPLAWVEKTAKEWPNLELVLTYCEVGSAFAGRYSVKGEVAEHETENGDYRGFVKEHFGFDPIEDLEDNEVGEEDDGEEDKREDDWDDDDDWEEDDGDD